MEVNISANYTNRENATNNIFVCGAQRTLFSTKLISVALGALIYHGGSTVIKALPATVNLLIGRLPASLTWRRVFNDHMVPLKNATKAIVAAPIFALTSSNIEQTYRIQKLAMFPKGCTELVKQVLEENTSATPPKELKTFNDGGQQEELVSKELTSTSAYEYVKRHPALSSLNLGVVIVTTAATIATLYYKVVIHSAYKYCERATAVNMCMPHKIEDNFLGPILSSIWKLTKLT